jgi:hypothetical protein
MTKAESIPEVENIKDAELSKMSAWARGKKLKFNEQKSQVMLMSRRKRKENKEVKICVNNKPLIEARSIKYLGIILDRNITFGGHINYMAEKCTKMKISLSKSAKLNGGLQHPALKTIYIGGIQPLLLYGAPVWNKAIHREKQTGS